MKSNKQTTIATLLRQRRSQREIERVTGIDRKTLRAHQRRFAAEVADAPGWPPGWLQQRQALHGAAAPTTPGLWIEVLRKIRVGA